MHIMHGQACAGHPISSDLKFKLIFATGRKKINFRKNFIINFKCNVHTHKRFKQCDYKHYICTHIHYIWMGTL